MRCIIAGSRNIRDANEIAFAIKDAQKQWGKNITVVLSGAAAGVDSVAASLAKAAGIPVEDYPAPWNGINPETNRPHGKGAGMYRNKQMIAKADYVIAVWDGKSKGTKNLIDEAQRSGLPVYVHKCAGEYSVVEP